MKKVSIISIIFVLIDQISKWLIKLFLNKNITIIPSFLNIIYVENRGAAFSILEGKQIFLIIITILILIGILYYIKRSQLDKFDTIIFGMLIGGMIGNVIDRIFLGYVIDFISFKLFNLEMPIFNLADTFICVGCFILIFKEEICKILNIKKKTV